MLAPGVLVKCLFLSKNKRGENKFPEDLFKYDAKITGLNRTQKIWLRKVQRSSGRAQATRQRPSGRNLWAKSPLSDSSARSLRARPGPGRRGLRWVFGGTFQQRQFPVCSPTNAHKWPQMLHPWNGRVRNDVCGTVQGSRGSRGKVGKEIVSD